MIHQTDYSRFPSSLEPWPFYYKFRGTELDVVKRALPALPGGVRLDIGCGIGFMSILLREGADRVLGIDLPYIDEASHSRGLDEARELCEKTANGGIRFTGGSAEDLPFADESMDLVFSAYTLEHVPDREKAAAEAARVLKPGGAFVFLLPGAAERVTFIPAYYLGLAGETWKWLKNRRARATRPGSSAGTTSEPEAACGGRRNRESSLDPSEQAGSLDRFRRRHPEFPRTAPHGDYPDSREEFRAHRRRAWIRLLGRNGLEVEKTVVSFFVPAQLVDRFSARLRMKLYELEVSILPISLRKSSLLLPFAQGMIYYGKKR